MGVLDARYKINGLIDTAQSAMRNLETITNSCNTWLSYDAIIGKWSVVINQPADPTAAFDDSNIIDGINLSTTPLDGFYNSVEVRFHNIDLRDKEDYVLLEIPTAQRYPNEPDNRLTINAPLINNQIQAQLVGLIELKQSRLDKVIEFKTDYSAIGLEAGEVITVTNTIYGWAAKEFRVLKTEEIDENGTIIINITAQEYNDNIYDTSDLYEYLRETEDGVIELDPLREVLPINDATDVIDSSGNSLLGLLGANTLIALIKKLMEDADTTPGSIYDQVFGTFADTTGKDLSATTFASTIATTISNTISMAKINAMAVTSDPDHVYGAAAADRNNWISAPVGTLPAGYSSFEVSVKTPTCLMDYDTLDHTGTQVTQTVLAQPAFLIQLLQGSSYATATVIQSSTIDWTSNNNKVAIVNPSAGTYWVALKLLPTYDLTLYWTGRTAEPNEIYFYNFVDAGASSSSTVFTAAALKY